jgi:MobA-like NTP transferase protein
MGEAKQLLRLGAKTVLGQVVENARGSGVDEIVLVLGHAAETIKENVAVQNLTVVINDERCRDNRRVAKRRFSKRPARAFGDGSRLGGRYEDRRFAPRLQTEPRRKIAFAGHAVHNSE